MISFVQYAKNPFNSEIFILLCTNACCFTHKICLLINEILIYELYFHITLRTSTDQIEQVNGKK